MTIASIQYEGLGAKTYLPEGPFGAAGQTPLPSFKLGTVVGGDAESEFVYLLFSPTASVTVNQGDFFTWDQSYRAVLTPAAAAGSISFGAEVGTFFLGGRIGDPAAAGFGQGDYFSYTFPVSGVYGIWVQRAGTSLLNLASVNAQTKLAGTSATVGKLDQPSAALANSMGVTGVYSAPTSGTFTANVTNGSAQLAACSTNKFLVIGQQLSGTGIPNGTVITDIQGATVTMSLPATATNATVTITASNMAFYCTTVNASPILTNVTSIAGLYPNQILSGTGIAASQTIVSIKGNAAPHTITMSANATASGTGISVTSTGYWEGYLRRPYVNVQN